MVKPGNESSEHSRAVRAEGAGFVILVLGLLLCLIAAPFRSGAELAEGLLAAEGAFLVAAGVFLLASVHKHYSRSRGDVKAAEARPAHRTAPSAV